MKKVNVQELKSNFPAFLAELERGISFLLCRRNVPVAELRPVATGKSMKTRKFGQHANSFSFNPEAFATQEFSEDFYSPLFVHEKGK